MLLFGHIGLTLGVGLVVQRVYSQIKNCDRREYAVDVRSPLDSLHGKPESEYVSRTRLVDIRLLTLGALLPDIIDKPVGLLFFNNGRIFSHSLLFAVLMLGAGIYLSIIRKKRWLIALSFGVLMHVILDSMWQDPQVLFWPFMGLEFASYEKSYRIWLISIFREMFSNPATYIPELIGLFITGGFIWKLVRDNHLTEFLHQGHY